MSVANTNTMDLTATTRALTSALEANEATEKAMVTELQKLASLKAENRRKAAQLTQALLSSFPTSDNSRMPQQSQEPLDDPTKSRDDMILYRPWNRLYFSDGTSVPEPNADTLRRRAVANDTFFYHTNPPWLAKESKVLLTLVQAQQQQANASAKAAIDFEQVAHQLHQRDKQTRGRSSSATSFPSATAKPRSALECEIEYHRQVHEKNQTTTSTTKKKSGLLSSTMISRAIASLTPTTTPAAAAAAAANTVKAGQGIDWQAVAAWIQEHEHIQTSAWECFAEYQKARRRQQQQQNDDGTVATPTINTGSSAIEPWTAKQDEVLLKYVAAMGPQALVDGHAMNHLLTRLLPNKSKSQLLNRINHSLLNPKLRHETWTADEERLLTVCMKMYTDTTTTKDAKSMEKQALYLAGTHLPHRATASVLHKWHRTLNPDYDTGPFTKAEDAKLLKVLRTPASRQLGWKELAQKHFPNRHAHRLMNRWSEIASNQDIIARFGKDFLRKNQNHDSSIHTSNKRSCSSSSRPLDAPDAVVPIAKKKKS